jgi:hypothetical protein
VTSFPFVVPPSQGIGVLFRRPVPPTGISVEVAAGPGARRGVGKCAGANAG